jgi:hypothetical protein
MLLFVCGWPACGKTYFGDWLETHRDFRHLDLEATDQGSQDLRELWEKEVPATAPTFVAALRKRHPHWVVTWGAPADCLPRLTAIRAAGFETWFLLPGNESRSRLEWLQRARLVDPETKPLAWEKKAGEIRKGARDLRKFFRDRCIESLGAMGERMPPEKLAERMGVPDPAGR